MTGSFLTPTIVVAPDSFKGSLTSEEAAHAIGRGLRRALPDARIHICPMADGGEGTLDAMVSAGGERRTAQVRGASGVVKSVTVGVSVSGVAIIESAEIVGITDPVGMSVPVYTRSTVGIGDAIAQLLDAGLRDFYIALGGSSTNDAGAGLLVALGATLYDAGGNPLEPILANLGKVAGVDVDTVDARIREARFIGLSDVENPLTGASGATAVFGPQKGVTTANVESCDAALWTFADAVERALGVSCKNRPGAGAAGGLGFALMALGGQLESGARVVARHVGLDSALRHAEWLITGEGRSDLQTLSGKAPFVAGQEARSLNVPTTLLSGAIQSSALSALSEHFDGCFSPIPGPMGLDEAIAHAGVLLEDAAEQIARLRFGNRRQAL